MFEIYSNLWKWVRHIGQAAPGKRVVFVNERCTKDRVSWFTPDGTGKRPELRIHNPDQAQPTQQPVDDRHVLTKLIKLAHESGHATSWNTNADGAWDAYLAATNRRRGVQMNFALTHWGADEHDPWVEPPFTLSSRSCRRRSLT